MAENVAMLPPARIALLYMLPCLCLAFFVPALSAQATTQTIPDELQDLIQRQINWDENQRGGKNPGGLSLQFSKIDETVSSGKRVALYRVYVIGAPEDKKFTLTVWRLGADPHVHSSGIYINSKGLLMVHKPSPDQKNSNFAGEDELHIAVQAARAEPIRYALSSSDKALLVYGTLVPFPREDTDRGCRLEVRLALPNAMAVLVYAEGLPANTVVPFQLFSGDTQETRQLSVNAQGHAVTTEFPAAYVKNRGLLKLKVATPECSVSVDIPWGEGSYHPL
jgi:hypothetical protein